MKTKKTSLTALGVGVVLALAAAASVDAQSSAPVTIPAGTILNVRLTQTIDADYATAGSTYSAVLDDPVLVGGETVIPRDAHVLLQAVAVKQSGTLKGSDKITLKANSVSFGGRTYDIVSSYVQTKGKGEGKRTAKKAGIGAGLGAAVGGLLGGGSGAAIGAAVGGTSGSWSLANQASTCGSRRRRGCSFS
jgi:YMGG-like Gly-zipper